MSVTPQFESGSFQGGAGGVHIARRQSPRRNGRWHELAVWWREIDKVLLSIVAALMMAGVIGVAAGSAASAQRLSTAETTLSDLHFFWMHLAFLSVGIAVMLAVSLLPRESARRFAILLAAGMFVLLVAVPFVGAEVNGARRWIRLGFGFQPSEFYKPAFTILCAWIISWRVRDPQLPVMILSGAVLGLSCLFLMLQPDFGTAMLLCGVWFVLMVTVGLPLQRVGWGAGGIVALVVGAYFFYDNARHRIDAFLGGSEAYSQVDLANKTLTNGGWFGRGLWMGERKNILPEAHTDYILSVIGEEFGLVAVAGIAMLFCALVVRVLWRLSREDDLFTLLSGTGLAALLGGQAFINMAVNLQLFPSKGMTLPLISYGGSSMIALCLTVGLLLAVTRRNPYLTRDGLPIGHRR
ncbi:FtsW/RodA/SpoVE family cell cycle protein [Croceicoccus bisphenolivorans]|uniref:FtsW/RodA/SpoVE family cell cycle protein n=1 Tax=Croceicoccus bisphenolivorans TaxID=1783232 RepID=UPI0009ED17EE|nr:putative peptidoglycan glycosyltransferase FtsW [Croceicoccus bisphenolivorans]